MRSASLRIIPLMMVLPFLMAAKPAAKAKPAAPAKALDREFFFYDKADETIKSDLLDNPSFYDAAAVSARGGLWLTWLEFVPGKGDEIWIGCREGAKWVSRKKLTAEPGIYANPTLSADRAGRLWLSYETEMDGQWDVEVRQEASDGSFADAVAWKSGGAGPDIDHRAVAASDVGIWVVWQGERSGRFQICATHLTGQTTAPVMVLSDPQILIFRAGADQPPTRDPLGGPRHHWRPDVAAGPDGTVYFVWDAYDGVSYNVYARACRGGTWTDIAPVAATAAFEGRVRVIAGKAGAWVAWEEGEENWGSVYRAGLTDAGRVNGKVTDERGPLHRFRRLRIGQLGWSQPRLTLRRLQQPMPVPSMDAAMKRTDAPQGVKASGAFYERAELACDRAGRLWVLWRHYYTPWLGIEDNHHVENGWGVYARCLIADGWSRLLRMEVNQGDGMQRLAVAPHGEGVAAVYTTGRTDRRNLEPPTGPAAATTDQKRPAPPAKPRPRGVVLALLVEGAAPASELPLGQQTELPAPGPYAPPAADATPESAGGYQMVLGDLHRHTDLSLCFVPTDGTIDDAYRYAIDAARLDFLGITDHTHDLAWGDPLCQLWWRSTKEVTRHELKPGFWPIFAYERSRSDTDHNVFSLRRDMLRPHTYPLPDFWKELDGDTFTVGHQPVKPSTWKVQDNVHRPLFEIYQGCRDVIVEKDANEALGRGYLMGFIASSDHLSTSASYAGAFVKERSRVAIFRALQARRSFAATGRIWILLRAGEHWMGEKLPGAAFPLITIEAGGSSNIETVEVLVDGQVEKRFTPGDRKVLLSYTPQSSPPGPHYLYVRLQQSDGNHAWSSPIWINAK